MDDYVARQPILNIKAQVCGYHLLLGQSIRNYIKALYKDPEDVRLSKSSKFDGVIKGLSDQAATYIDFFDDLLWTGGLQVSEKAKNESTVVVFQKDTAPTADICEKIKARGFMLALDSTFFLNKDPAAASADIMMVDFTSVSLAAQAALIKKHKSHVRLLARKIETWSDFKVAKDMGYQLFQGFFFLWPTDALAQKEIKSLDVCMIAILHELEKPEPNFKSISDTIEHDLGLSYKLLRLVNSAYMAPKYRIKSITQALTYLGTRELHQWISMLMFNGIKSEDNSELVVMSLIRGKMMALIAQELQIAQTGSEPFFTGLLSLIDVILNKDMNALLTGLPLTDDIKAALTGGSNMLSELLSFIVSYEQAEWQRVEDRFPMNRITPQRMAEIYIDAHRWSRLLD
jgi:c-di-GMP-related signal transduction protein